ncbi:hypothetical protein HPB48_016418 [Haemaphysalis longicornis]|uniref:Rho GTPase-activating protein pG1 and pG2 domain-containing protein n=1 Tax=Haemaphysalis longicornis TaxID=44386 RepID=A0A9J6GVU0_HAELO|nr:hypothetical protein HPB48_016418 [Haemaphysalis longicornis]
MGSTPQPPSAQAELATAARRRLQAGHQASQRPPTKQARLHGRRHRAAAAPARGRHQRRRGAGHQRPPAAPGGAGCQGQRPAGGTGYAAGVPQGFWLDDKAQYALDFKIDGDVGLPHNSFHTEPLPHSCLCVYTSQPGLEYIRESLEKTLLANLEQENRLPFHGLPLVMVFAGQGTSCARRSSTGPRACSALRGRRRRPGPRAAGAGAVRAGGEHRAAAHLPGACRGRGGPGWTCG